jgi:hypothetical protein
MYAMTRAIHKQRIEFRPGPQSMGFPPGSIPVAFGFQETYYGQAAAFWYSVDVDRLRDAVGWEIRIVATGEGYPDEYGYLGGPAMQDDGTVWHLVGKQS